MAFPAEVEPKDYSATQVSPPPPETLPSGFKLCKLQISLGKGWGTIIFGRGKSTAEKTWKLFLFTIYCFFFVVFSLICLLKVDSYESAAVCSGHLIGVGFSCFTHHSVQCSSVKHVIHIYICKICTMLEKSSMIQPNRLCVVSTWGEGSRDSNASHPVLEPERHGPSNFKLKGNKFNLKLNGKQNCIKNMIEGRAMQINLLEKKRRKT